MKRFVSIILVALFVGGLWASAAHATASRGANCLQCHSFANQPPVANAGADQSVNAGAPVTLSGTASRDADDGIASYSWTQTGGTTVTLTNANSVSASFTAPSVTAQTVLTFQLTVRDRLPQSSTDTVAITVRPSGTPPPNQAPVANAGADQTAVSGAVVTLNGSLSSDPDDGIASYAWSQTGSPAVTLSNTAVASPAFTAPQVTAATTLTFSLRVTDRSGLSATDTCLVTVNPPGSPNNKLPTANAGVDLMILPGTFHNLDGFYSNDPDDGIVSYAWQQTSGPTVALSDPKAMNPVFQAPLSPTTLTFQLSVTDKGGLQSSDTCTVVVLSPDGGTPVDTTPPTVNLTSPAGGAAVSGALTISAMATDDVGVAKVEFYAGSVLLGTGANSSGGTWQYSWNTTTSANGSTSLTARAYDAAGNSKTSSAVTVTVQNGAPPPVNKPPVANAGKDREVRSGETVKLSGVRSSDPDDGMASYQWRQLSGTSVRLSGSTSVNASFTAPRVYSKSTKLTFELTVRDKGGLSASDRVTITVRPAEDD